MAPLREDILDLPARKSQSVWQLRLFYTAIACFTYYFAAEWLGWPGFALSLVTGLVCFAGIATMRFRKNRRSGPYQYAYFLGHLSLLTGIGLYLLQWPQATYLFWTAFAGFGIGLGLLWRKGQ